MSNSYKVRSSISRMVSKNRLTVQEFRDVCVEEGWDILNSGSEHITIKHSSGERIRVRFPAAEYMGGLMSHNLDMFCDNEVTHSSRSAGKYFASAVAAGDINRAEFKKICANYNWEIVREKAQSISIRHSDGKKFRVSFNDDYTGHSKYVFTRKGYKIEGGVWIYGLIAQSSDGEKACYIGQTRCINHRLKEHGKTRKNKSSYYLKKWAEERSAEIKVVLLAHAELNRIDATKLESFWIDLAATNYELPGVDKWGRLPKSVHFDWLPVTTWPENRVMGNLRPLSSLLNQSITQWLEWSEKALFSFDDHLIKIVEN